MLGVLALLAACFQQKATTQANNTVVGFSPESHFKTVCASCHGATVETFVDRKWKKGTTRTDLINSIAKGDENAGMPAFGTTMRVQDVEAMADYVLAAIERGKTFEFAKVPKTNTFKSNGITVRLDTVAKGLTSPWGVAQLPDGSLLITDRSGRLYRTANGGNIQLIEGTPKVSAEGQGGLLDIALHPNFATNNIIYLSYSKPKDSLGAVWSTTALLRATLAGNSLREARDIFVAQPWLKTKHHYGSRIAFDKNGYLFLTVGDRGQHKANLPQLTDNDCGKIHRLHDDGRIPSDNPFSSPMGVRSSIWSYGHRNPQGLMVHPETGALWATEHGPRGGDELNLIRKKMNYGWPVISYGINYDGTVLTPLTKQEGMEQPAIYWTPSLGVCGMAFVTSDRYPAWKNNILNGSLRFEYLNRCKMSGNQVVEQESLLPHIGRLRCVYMGHDGYIYVGVEQPGFVFRLLPVQNG